MRDGVALLLGGSAMRSGRIALCVALFALTWAGVCLRVAHAYEAGDLPKVEGWVRDSYRSVAQLSADDLDRMRASGAPLLLFDVRAADEFEVSHLPGAVRVDPGQWSWTFLDTYGESVEGRTVVFYCSVGARSSKLAESVQEALISRGAKGVYNLEGGIFRWHNEQQPLFDRNGPTDWVHPYDATWGRLVDRKDKIATQPQSPQLRGPTVPKG